MEREHRGDTSRRCQPRVKRVAEIRNGGEQRRVGAMDETRRKGQIKWVWREAREEEREKERDGCD